MVTRVERKLGKRIDCWASCPSVSAVGLNIAFSIGTVLPGSSSCRSAKNRQVKLSCVAAQVAVELASFEFV